LVARLAYLGLLEAWTSRRPRIHAWWARTQEWPSFKRGLADLVTATEFADMRTHGLTVRDDIEALIAKIRDK
ncbi:MAG: ganglioside-induced differentiation-associated protein 1, partial [Alphaproteobacteria bacterium]|nr:ganglioside-induced differentiation-associated protein 1 [Alphaproteobacteria bacterium]